MIPEIFKIFCSKNTRDFWLLGTRLKLHHISPRGGGGVYEVEKLLKHTTHE